MQRAKLREKPMGVQRAEVSEQTKQSQRAVNS